MKRHFVIAAVLLLSIAAISTSAQTQPATPAATPTPAASQSTPISVPIISVPPAKIAFVDTSGFGDEKTGIIRFVIGIKNLQNEFKTRQDELDNLQSRIKTMNDDIAKLRGTAVVAPQSIQSKEAEAADLQRAWEYKKGQADADFAKRYPQAIGPIQAAIGKALDEYALKNGLTLVLDISKLLPAVLTMNPAADVTRAFIADYNSKNP